LMSAVMLVTSACPPGFIDVPVPAYAINTLQKREAT